LGCCWDCCCCCCLLAALASSVFKMCGWARCGACTSMYCCSCSSKGNKPPCCCCCCWGLPLGPAAPVTVGPGC
jgi:hypothetical protein